LSIIADEIRRKKRENLNEVLQFPKDLGAHAMLLIFSSYSYQRPGTRLLNKVSNETFSSQNLKGTQNILLPLPQNIQDNFQVRVQRFDQEGFLGEAVSDVGKMMSNSGDVDIGQIRNQLSSSLGIDRNKITEMSYSDMSRSGAFLARRGVDQVLPGATRNLDAGFGSTINPKAALCFEGVEMKTHTFNWNLAPTSFEESDTLKDIGNLIKRNILPSYGNFANNKTRLLLNYPSIVDIFFLGIEQSYFVHFKSCMVQQFNIDFSPQGLAFLKGGKPALVNMSMNVIETDIHTAEDYDGTSKSYPGTSIDKSPPGNPTSSGGAQ
jgi:hypothetical protein